MLFDLLVISEIALGVVFSIYNYFMFNFADAILVKPRIAKPFRLLVVAINTFFVVALMHSDTNTMLAYVVMFLLLFLEFMICYKSKVLQVLFMISVYTLHIMAVRAISVAVFSTVTGISFYEVVKNPYLFSWATSITFFVLIFFTLLVKKIIPSKKLRILVQNKEQFLFISAWSFVYNLYLFSNSWVFTSNESYSFLNGMQISSSFAILLTQYLLLFFALKTSSLLGYKEKNSQLEQEISMEQQYRGSIVNDAIVYYEFNLTNNTIKLGLEKFSNLVPKEISNIYTAVLNLLVSRVVYTDDVHAVHQYTSQKNLMNELAKGKSEISLEYRRLGENGKYIWVRATTNLVIDKSNGAVRGFTYIKDIDHKKMLQIELKEKAERDVLTGLYNKGMTGKLISDYLEANSFGDEISAALIIDVDNFKTINDSLGHTFGDAVLCELAEKLKKIFRNNDIIGRIGGDEFMAFMTNIKDYKILTDKAKLICENFRNSYEGNSGEEFSVSSSVGIAIAPQHGETFEELYKHADIALYNSKNSGKDTFMVYNGEAFVEYKSNRTQIDPVIDASNRGFRDNRIEYIFKILYGSDTSTYATRSILELLAKHFHFSRGYVFEADKDDDFISNTFEWCDYGIEPLKDTMQHLPISSFDETAEAIRHKGAYIICDSSLVEGEKRAELESIDVKFRMQLGVFEKDKLMGIIGFDDCIKKRNLMPATTAEIATICNVFALFIIKQRAMEEAQDNFAVLSGIMDRLDTFSYVVSKDTRRILFVNKRTKELADDIKPGDFCYSSFRGEGSVCTDCPIKGLDDEFDSKCVLEINNKKFGIWTESTATYIKWINGETACLINCVDITKYKKAPML